MDQVSSLSANDSPLLVALLAAGQSRRFGSCKLTTELVGMPLIGHAMLGYHHFTHKILVTGTNRQRIEAAIDNHPDRASWRVIHNPTSEEGISTSVALAARCALTENFGALLIGLADMPTLPSFHMSELVASYKKSPNVAMATSWQRVRQPPVIFPRCSLAELLELQGDRGAGKLLAQANVTECRQKPWDIDTIEELKELLDNFDRNLLDRKSP